MADYSHLLNAGRADPRMSSPDVVSARHTPRSDTKDEVYSLRTQLRQLQDKCAELEKALEDGRRRENMLSKLQDNTINLMQTMQRSHDEATDVLTSRIKSLESIVEPCRREAAEAVEVRERLQAKESECEELVSQYSKT
jgi:predicted  nucleic acid-binding Zn-ribbon protein